MAAPRKRRLRLDREVRVRIAGRSDVVRVPFGSYISIASSSSRDAWGRVKVHLNGVVTVRPLPLGWFVEVGRRDVSRLSRRRADSELCITIATPGRTRITVEPCATRRDR